MSSFDSNFSELELPHPTLPGFFEWPPSLLLHPHHHQHTSLQLPVMAIHPQSPLLLPSIFSLSVTVSRTGWVRRDVENPESIADHMYRMGLMALIASSIPGVD
ncbi:unnamed protein product [Camellia sinensis]